MPQTRQTTLSSFFQRNSAKSQDDSTAHSEGRTRSDKESFHLTPVRTAQSTDLEEITESTLAHASNNVQESNEYDETRKPQGERSTASETTNGVHPADTNTSKAQDSVEQTSASNIGSTDLLAPSPEPKFSLRCIIEPDILPLKRLLGTLLPVNYPPSFFRNVVTLSTLISRAAIWNAQPGSNPLVGAIVSRVEDVPPLPGRDGKPQRESQLYIQTIGVLAPYRRFGIAKQMLEEVLEQALGLEAMVTSVYAHVWMANPEALEWYRKQGFEVEEEVQDYYRRLKPGGAWLVRRKLR